MESGEIITTEKFENELKKLNKDNIQTILKKSVLLRNLKLENK